jgi:pyruvate kinase
MPFRPLAAAADPASPQLVVTLTTASVALAGALARSGATAFRLNASHLRTDDLGAALTSIRDGCPGAPVLVDLQGAKMRVDVAAPRDVRAGESVVLSLGHEGDIQVPHREFFEQARVGDTASIDDGRVRFGVERTGSTSLVAAVLTSGLVLARKGINVEQHPVHLSALSERDREACRVAAAFGGNAVAYSFMTDGREAGWVRQAAPGCAVVGKVERQEATQNLAQIASATDAMWICRGDLGAQLGLRDFARFVAGVAPPAFGVPVLMAGQVLEHLTDHREATRSEVCHLYDLLVRGFAGIVLSDETALGRDPVHATGVAAGLLASFRH